MRSRCEEEGQALVEFALVLPVVLLLIFAIIQLSLVLGARQNVAHAAQVAANAYAQSLRLDDARAQANAAAAGLRPGLLQAGGVSFRVVDAAGNETPVLRDGAGARGQFVVAQADYRYPSPIRAGVAGFRFPDQIPISREGVALIERPTPTPSPRPTPEPTPTPAPTRQPTPSPTAGPTGAPACTLLLADLSGFGATSPPTGDLVAGITLDGKRLSAVSFGRGFVYGAIVNPGTWHVVTVDLPPGPARSILYPTADASQGGSYYAFDLGRQSGSIYRVSMTSSYISSCSGDVLRSIGLTPIATPTPTATPDFTAGCAAIEFVFDPSRGTPAPALVAGFTIDGRPVTPLSRIAPFVFGALVTPGSTHEFAISGSVGTAGTGRLTAAAGPSPDRGPGNIGTYAPPGAAPVQVLLQTEFFTTCPQ